MAKYNLLRDYLSNHKDVELQLTFKQIEGIIKDELPWSAYHLRQFWQNSYSVKRRHVQAIAWHNAEWKVSKVDFQGQTVTFSRESKRG